MTLIHLGPSDVLCERPFTDLRHTQPDLQTLRFMVMCAWMALELPSGEGADRPGPFILHQPTADQWTQRIVITQPARLRSHKPLTVVGFFGLKSALADVALAQKLDRQLLPELTAHAELLAYLSICLPTGNFANLVLFASPEGKDAWGQSERHSLAVRLLTPDYYSAVRLYNGDLPGGVAAGETLRLRLVKYYDYSSRPLWRAVRLLSAGSVP